MAANINILQRIEGVPGRPGAARSGNVLRMQAPASSAGARRLWPENGAPYFAVMLRPHATQHAKLLRLQATARFLGSAPTSDPHKSSLAPSSYMGGTRGSWGLRPDPARDRGQEADAPDACDLERENWTLKSRGLRPELTL